MEKAVLLVCLAAIVLSNPVNAMEGVHSDSSTATYSSR